jgi:hypothetical protein
MLSLIGDFLHADVDKQALAELQNAVHLHQQLQANLLFFKSINPDLFQLIVQHSGSRYSVFCTKDMQLNLVEVSSGRVLYAENPALEATEEVSSFCKAAPVVSLVEADTYPSLMPVPPAAVILLFGIGAGLHLELLIRNAKPSILVMYEPETDFFVASLHIIDWKKVYQVAAEQGTQISLQIGNSGNSISADLKELADMLPNLKNLYLYRHLAHPVSDEVFNYLRLHSGRQAELLQSNLQFIGFTDDALFVPERTAGVLANRNYREVKNLELYTQNMQALKQYYPVLYKTFSGYQPKYWRCIEDEGQLNLACTLRPGLFYRELKADSVRIVERYLKSPIESQIILNQGGLDKFKSYIHYQSLQQLQPVLTSLQPRVFDEEVELDYLIVLGVALGQHIELLLEQRVVNNLFIFEPNPDFFYASLFVTNWAKLLREADTRQQRFYFNIGGSGDEYFQDIMAQYYQSGAYGIANSQIFPAYLTPGMRRALTKLQSQLRIIVAMGEYFDHVRYGVAHTYKSLLLGHKFLKNHRDRSANKLLKNVPVFIIGNGPSLDSGFQYLQEYRQHIIIISCGTALRSLYKLGIKPDYHAEIEQNRATHSWISQVPDVNWLKSIPLLSVNGIHPETAALFESVYLVFKDGESSTSFFRSTLERNNLRTAALRHAYPTVSNFVLDLLTELGVGQVYLLGVDLGYHSAENHHSKYSAYFQSDGKGVMDASKIFATNLKVKGNFRPQIQTKPEFDFSRSIMELTIAAGNKSTSFYNCSDGAYISGAMPLHPENILIKPTDSNVRNAFHNMFEQFFYKSEVSDFANFFEQEIKNAGLSEVTHSLIEMLDRVDNYSDARLLIEKQWQFFIRLYDKENKLSFYLLCGSMIYMLSVLTRVLPAQSEFFAESASLQTFNKVIDVWRDYLQKAGNAYASEPFACCNVDVSFLFKGLN